jgi:RNA polymerase sigma factor (sigma-70 family)
MDVKEFAEKNIGILHYWCGRKLNQSKGTLFMSFRDLLGEMSVTYMIAVKTYLKKDPAREISFSTWVYNQLQWHWQYHRNNDLLISLPKHQYKSEKRRDAWKNIKSIRVLSDDADQVNRKLSYNPNFYANMERKELLQKMRSYIRQASVRQRQVIDGYLQSKSFAQIGRELGVTRQAVETTFKSAIREMRGKFCV